MSRSARTLLTFLSGTGMAVVLTAVNFVTLPFVLRHLGDARFGIFRSLLDWFGWLALLDLGVGSSLGPVYARVLGRGDGAGVVRVAHAGLAAFARVTVVMAAAAVLLGALMPRLVQAPAELEVEVYAACAVLLLGVLLLPLNAFRSLADAGQRGFVVNVAVAVGGVLVAGLSVAAAYSGAGLVGQSLATVVAAGAVLLLLARDGLRQYPAIRREPFAPDPALRAEFRAVRWPWLAFNVTGRLGVLSHNILIAGLLGPTAATVFFLTHRLISLVHGQLLGVGASSWAALADLYYRGETARFAARTEFLTRLLSTLGLGLLIPVGVWNHATIGLWVGPERYGGAWVTWPAVALAWAQAIVALWSWPLTVLAPVRRLVPGMIAATAVNLTLSVAVTLTVGLPGPVVGAAVAQTALAFGWLPVLLRRGLGLDPGTLRRAALEPLALAVGYGGALLALAESVAPFDPAWPRSAQWLALAGCHVAGTAGYLALAWAVILPAVDRREFRQMAGRVVRR